MFTGIAKELGIVQRLDRAGSLSRLAIESTEISKTVDMGDSISVNGVCLTLVEKKKKTLYFDIMEETMRKSNLVTLKNNDRVNLEASLKADGAIGGHFVLGHIDCIGRITEIRRTGEEFFVEVEFSKDFTPLVVEKGSVALDGISLTIAEIADSRFKVYLIPYTLKTTTLGSKKIGEEVNIEFDIIGKYIYKSSKLKTQSSKVTEGFLKERGFV